MDPPFFFVGECLKTLETDLLALFEDRKGIEKKFFELCCDVVKDKGLELYDLEYLGGQSTLRLYIQNAETKTADLNDCASVDRAMTPFVEEADWMPEELVLEVSSPGIYRKLRTLEHFESALGQTVAFSFLKDAKDVKQAFKNGRGLGTLKSIECDKESFLVSVEGKEFSFKFSDLKKANIEPAWDEIQAQ